MKRDKNQAARNISLAPLSPEQALFAAMNTKPSAGKKADPKPKKVHRLHEHKGG